MLCVLACSFSAIIDLASVLKGTNKHCSSLVVPLVHLSSFSYLLKVQATSLACTLRLYSF